MKKKLAGQSIYVAGQKLASVCQNEYIVCKLK